ncbi:MAG: 30S ribosomal protein S9 [Sedimentisphaerales bacterium]|nr:30S ribosomal protein S9 [Sedimentisphaerales bacterium]
MAQASENSPVEGLNIGTSASAASKKAESKDGFFWGTGRRKTSIARVRIKPGSGELKINKKKLDEYFTRPQDVNAVVAPLKTTKTEKSIDVLVNVKGGGITGQSGAVMLGIARALKNYDPSLIGPLRDAGLLTRDGRMVERKKPGQPGARRRFQFSKR